MQRRRRLAAALAALALLPAVAASAAEDPELPGLPLLKNGQWDGVASQGITEATKAKQWLRLPPMRLATFTYNQPRSGDDKTCTRTPPYSTVKDFEADVFIMPTDGSGGYGSSPTFTVRSLAFGAVPVEVTLRVHQERAEDGLPRPWRVHAPTYTFCIGREPHPVSGLGREFHSPSNSLVGTQSLSVERVVVDGVDLRVSEQCGTDPSPIHLAGREYFSQAPDNRPDETTGTWDWKTSRYYLGPEGGLLEGTVDIPPFHGCTTPDDDVSAMLTGLVSSSNNPISVRASGLYNYCGPKSTSSDPCPTGEPMPLPTKDD